MPGILQENEKAEPKLAMGDIAKKIANMWQGVPDDKKKPYLDNAKKLRLVYCEEVTNLKCSKVWRNFLDNRKRIKDKACKELYLRNLPKRPKSVFAMFCEEHKNEVPAGRGDGKGRNWVQHIAFASLHVDRDKGNGEPRLRAFRLLVLHLFVWT